MLNTFAISSTFMGGLFQETFVGMSAAGKRVVWEIVPLLLSPCSEDGVDDIERKIADRIDELAGSLSDEDARAFARMCDVVTVCWPDDADPLALPPHTLAGRPDQPDVREWGQTPGTGSNSLSTCVRSAIR